MVKVAHDCLMKALAICKPGTRYRDIGDVITKHAAANGFQVVRSYCGHGIGGRVDRGAHKPPKGGKKQTGGG